MQSIVHNKNHTWWIATFGSSKQPCPLPCNRAVPVHYGRLACSASWRWTQPLWGADMTQAEASRADALGLPFAANAIGTAAGEQETHGAEPSARQLSTRSSQHPHAPPRPQNLRGPPDLRHLLWHAPEVLWFLCSKDN